MASPRRPRVVRHTFTGPWHLAEAKPGPPRKRPRGRLSWLSAAVPGDVGQALLDAGRIPDPCWSDNLRRCQWIEDRDWWYRLEFDRPPAFPTENVELAFESIDLLGEVWLNGRCLGETDNAFRTWTFDVTGRLKATGNTLLVRLRALGPLLDAFGPWRENEHATDARLAYRTCQCLFGWDWAPILPAIGLGPVRLVGRAGPRIEDVHVRTRINGDVDVFVELYPKPDQAGTLDIAIRGHGADLNARRTTTAARSVQSFRIENPRLWWPNGYGDQPLYDLRVRYRHGRRILDERALRFGIREIGEFEEPYACADGKGDSPLQEKGTVPFSGLSWGVTVNGVKVHVQGSNWVPVDLFPHTPRPARYERLLRRAAEANFNMLRVWGGGIYEHDVFYDLCDRLGILVWQDFMFASGRYPSDEPAFRDNITAEAEEQVRRLRSRPSVAVWCGCNEDSSSWGYRRKKGEDLYNVILPGVVAVQDGTRPYVVSSPWSRTDAGNDPSTGNCHLSCYKFCRDARAAPRPQAWRTYRQHFETVVSFDSEFCVNGPCRRESLERYMPADRLWPFNDLWMFRNCMPSHIHQAEFAEQCVGPVTDLDSFLKGAMAVHMEHVRGEFENARRAKFDCGGTMGWMFGDIWPTANWAIIDYHGVPKPAFYAAKRACEPVAVIILDLAGAYRCWVANDRLTPVRGRVEIRQEDFDGAVLWRRSKRLTVPANASREAFAVPHSTWRPERNSCLIARFTSGNETAETVFFPNLWRDIDWPEPGLSMRVAGRSKRGGRHVIRVEVRTERFARLVHLDAPDLADAVVSDSFFDLPAGGRRLIEIETATRLRPGDVHLGHWLTDWR